MLLREEADGFIAIGQPAHAWVSGQMARAWGNARFGAVAPWEEVCLGAEQHDVGMAAWDGAPALDPATGRPCTFREFPPLDHLALWSRAAPLLLVQSRYAALLASLHGTYLYERRDLAADPPEVAAAVRAFLAEQQRFQAELLATLRADPRYAEHATPATVERNRHLVRVWDALSLAICHGQPGARTFVGVPAAGGSTVSLTLRSLGESRAEFAVEPWPFTRSEVALIFEGRRLPAEPFADEPAMRAALTAAPWVTLTARLGPG